MSDEHLRIFLEARRNCDSRNILCNRIEGLQRIGAHKEIEFADGQQNAVVHVRPAGDDGHIEAVLLVRAVRERLVKTAVLSFRDPVGAKTDLVQLLGLRRPQRCRKPQ